MVVLFSPNRISRVVLTVLPLTAETRGEGRGGMVGDGRGRVEKSSVRNSEAVNNAFKNTYYMTIRKDGTRRKGTPQTT